MAGIRRAGPPAVAMIALVALLGAPGVSDAKVKNLRLRYGPIALEAAGIVFHNTRVRTPQVNGFVTRIHAYVVDNRGRRLDSGRVMLHHAVFRRRITPKYDRECNTRRETEPFYATGEEDETLRLPPGYGLRVTPHDGWLVRWMLMNHSDVGRRVFIQYDVRVDTSRAVVPVRPLWARVVKCREEYFDVPGGGGPGSIFTKARDIAVSRTGRIVMATGHLHGGAISLALSEPRCGNREIFTARPVYRAQTSHDPVPAPVPHDGPVHVTSFTSAVGIPIFRGQLLTLAATYDNSVTREDVMGTMHVYVAADRPAAFDCAPLPPPGS
jgi:hypothetical protein